MFFFILIPPDKVGVSALPECVVSLPLERLWTSTQPQCVVLLPRRECGRFNTAWMRYITSPQRMWACQDCMYVLSNFPSESVGVSTMHGCVVLLHLRECGCVNTAWMCCLTSPQRVWACRHCMDVLYYFPSIVWACQHCMDVLSYFPSESVGVSTLPGCVVLLPPESVGLSTLPWCVVLLPPESVGVSTQTGCVCREPAAI